jgi:uncharacterized OB-fold protein
MICKVCGKELRKDAKFCTECGTKVDVNTANIKAEEPVKPITVDSTSNVNSAYVPFNKSKAVASLVLGIISLLLGGISLPLSITGLVLGLNQKEKCGEKTAGIILNTIAIVISVISIILVTIFIIAIVQSENGGGYYESSEDNNGNSDIIIKDDGNIYDYDYDYNDYFDFDLGE